MNLHHHPERNAPCPCGSGKKYKHCCGQLQSATTQLTVHPGDATVNALVALFHAGQYAQLEEQAKLLAARFPQSGIVWKILGLALQQQGKAAIATLQQATALLPDDAEAHCNLGVALRGSGRLEEAIARFCKALSLAPAFAAARINLGDAFTDLHKHAASTEQIIDAEAMLRRVLHAYPEIADVHFHLALLLHDSGRLEDGEKGYRHTIHLQADHTDAHNNLGNLLMQQARMQEAEASLRTAIKHHPDHADAHYNLANLLKDAERWQEAEQAYQQALALQPQMTEAALNLANLLQENFRLDEAQALLLQMIARDPQSAKAHFNLGNLHLSARRFDDADQCYRQALSLEPGNADIRLHRAFLLLQRGDFGPGWQEFEQRWHIRDLPTRPQFAQPLWLGEESLQGKAILLHAEWGLGDTLQFVRYAPLLARSGATVYLQVPQSLVRLLANCEGVAGVFGEGDALPAFDYHCPILSLPLAFKTTLQTIPANVPYLKADEASIAIWKNQFSNTPSLHVGLVWAGGSHRDARAARIADRQRSLHFSQIQPLLDVPGVVFHSLQVGSDTAPQCRNDARIIDHSATLTDFNQSAALIANLDLVISVDTSTAHLAGGMGKPVWLLNRYNSCWRWLIGQEDSLWYPSMRIFSQRELGNWGSVIAAVMMALRNKTQDYR
jgi:tetratricopeptide (TPR) repeat protein